MLNEPSREVNLTQVKGSKDCGNSPKNKFVQDVAVAMECGEAVPDAFSEDVTWVLPSADPVSGRSAVLEHVGSRTRPSSVTVQHAISHGKVGAASGEVTLANGHTQRFCHVFEFTNTKANCVAVVRSYS
ncbi:nuclear transport factor 2 family protein [Halodurantibacterium flavum]|uniref:Nuclear transport factor 2 family protein n=1 Tax=Halodurantibacterium flavum TaxID=1382802 RepID=A0ABW4S4J0_9RHOB